MKNNNLNIIDDIVYTIKNKIYNIHEPDKLLNFINENLSPKEKEKNERGEVFTPIALVNEMLDKLPIEVWNNPNFKWLDPSSGMGNFPIAVYMRLIKSLKNHEMFKGKTEEDIRKHILENMLFMVEINRKNVYLIKRILCNKNYKLNIFEGSFLDYKTDNKFDIIMGNPPYQDTNKEGKRKALNHNLWSIFIELSFNELLKDNGFLVFITPISWMTPTYENKDIFYKNYILYLNINECEKWFNVGSTFSYYIIQKTNKQKETEVICLYNNKIYKSSLLINKIKFLPILLTKESISIIKKFFNNKLLKISFNNNYELHSSTKKHLINKCDKTKFIYKIKHTVKNKDLCSSVKHSLANKNKILLNISGYLDPIYDNGIYGFTEAQMYYLTNNKNYIKILNSNLYKFIFKLCKWSGFNTKFIYKNIPYINHFISNENLNMLFKLNKKEINLINEIIGSNDKYKSPIKVKSL